MNLLHWMASEPITQAIGWTLLHSLWGGALVAALLWLALAGLRSSRTRYAAAYVALTILSIAFVCTATALLPHVRPGPRPFTSFAAGPWRDPLAQSTSSLPDWSAIVPWLAPVWFLGVCIYYLRYAMGWFALREMQQRGSVRRQVRGKNGCASLWLRPVLRVRFCCWNRF